MAELKGEPNPDLFKRALARFEEAAELMTQLDRKMEELTAIQKAGKLDPTFASSLTKILREHPPLERVRTQNVRYANVARVRSTARALPPGKSLDEVMQAQRADLAVVAKHLRETIEAFRSVLPATEKGEFAALMLSGRAGFADKIQQAVDQIETYAQFYTRSCMTTIAATMQAYPAGLRWLKDTNQGRRPGS